MNVLALTSSKCIRGLAEEVKEAAVTRYEFQG